MFNACLFKQGKNLYNTLVKNNFVKMSTNKKKFSFKWRRNLAEDVKNFPALSSHSYRDSGVLRNAWV